MRVVRTHTYVSHPVRALSSATYLLPYPYSVSALTYTPVALDGESNERTRASLYTVRSSPTRAMRPRAHARLTASDAVASMSIDRANVRARSRRSLKTRTARPRERRPLKTLARADASSASRATRARYNQIYAHLSTTRRVARRLLVLAVVFAPESLSVNRRNASLVSLAANAASLACAFTLVIDADVCDKMPTSLSRASAALAARAIGAARSAETHAATSLVLGTFLPKSTVPRALVPRARSKSPFGATFSRSIARASLSSLSSLSSSRARSSSTHPFAFDDATLADARETLLDGDEGSRRSFSSSSSSSSELDSSPRRTTAAIGRALASQRLARVMTSTGARDGVRVDDVPSTVPAFMTRESARAPSRDDDRSDDPREWRDDDDSLRNRHRCASIANAAFDALATRAMRARDAHRKFDVPDDALETLAWLYGAKHLRKALEVVQHGRVRRARPPSEAGAPCTR